MMKNVFDGCLLMRRIGKYIYSICGKEEMGEGEKRIKRMLNIS